MLAELQAVSSGPLWAVVLAPIATVVGSSAAVWAVLRSALKDRDRAADQRREDAREREDRIDAACDLVLGRDADVRRGRRKISGLVETVPALADDVRNLSARIGHFNGNRKTLMEQMHETVESLRVVQAALHELVPTVNDIQATQARHEQTDEQTFAVVHRRLARLEQHGGEMSQVKP